VYLFQFFLDKMQEFRAGRRYIYRYQGAAQAGSGAGLAEIFFKSDWWDAHVDCNFDWPYWPLSLDKKRLKLRT
jgi:hypothetical protein